MKVHAQMDRWTLCRGDVLDVLSAFSSESVQCMETRPPYRGLRDYDLPPTEWSEIEYSPMDWLPPITFPGLAI